MGCNIHGYIEVKQYEGSDYWEAVHDLPYTRNYPFYAAIAGVRNYSKITPISKPKGLPYDVTTSSRVESEKMGSDGHSHSFLTYNELSEYDWMQSIEDTLLIDCIHINFKSLIKEMGYFVSHYGDTRVRMVFWFDN